MAAGFGRSNIEFMRCQRGLARAGFSTDVGIQPCRRQSRKNSKNHLQKKTHLIDLKQFIGIHAAVKLVTSLHDNANTLMAQQLDHKVIHRFLCYTRKHSQRNARSAYSCRMRQRPSLQASHDDLAALTQAGVSGTQKRVETARQWVIISRCNFRTTRESNVAVDHTSRRMAYLAFDCLLDSGSGPDF
jgi:hypothetical protein